MLASWREQLAFAPMEAVERSEEILLRLRHAIELGVLEDGAQLPSENDLASRMRISTMTLRTALAELRHLGLLETRRGKGGGSFVKANVGDIAKAQRATLETYTLEGLRDIREYRAFLAGAAAAAAASRRQQISIGRLAQIATMIEAAQTPAEMTRADSQFHIELAATSGSVLFTRQEIAMQAEVGALVWAGASDNKANAAREHTLIVDAIRDGDPSRARSLAEDHVRQDMNNLIDLRMVKDRGQGRPNESNPAQAVSGVEALTLKLEEGAAVLIGTVEEAVHLGLDRSRSMTLEELEGVYDVARESLLNGPPAFYGAGFVADQSFFGETGLIWCYFPVDRRSPQRFQMMMDSVVYDFSTAPFWPRQDAPAEVSASCAYVDTLGSNEYLITFTKPVIRGGRMAGIAAVDILISRLQAEFDPLLSSLPPNACIVDQNYVVIATNTASLLGEILTNGHRAEQRIPLLGTGWTLCLGVSPKSNGIHDEAARVGH